MFTRLKTEPFRFIIPSPETELIHLADFLSVGLDPALNCGELAFRLVEEIPFLEMTTEGVITMLAQTDKSWIGEYKAAFIVYLKDIDPDGIYEESLQDVIEITIIIEEEVIIS